MKKDLEKLVSERSEYDAENQSFIDSLRFEDKEISQINDMKQSSGWKLLDKKIREELQARISELIKDDLKIQTLLALLNVADTKTRNRILEGEIEKLLPEA